MLQQKQQVAAPYCEEDLVCTETLSPVINTYENERQIAEMSGLEVDRLWTYYLEQAQLHPSDEESMHPDREAKSLSISMDLKRRGNWIGAPIQRALNSRASQTAHAEDGSCFACHSTMPVTALVDMTMQRELEAGAVTATQYRDTCARLLPLKDQRTHPYIGEDMKWVHCIARRLTPELAALVYLQFCLPRRLGSAVHDPAFEDLYQDGDGLDLWLKQCGFTGNPETVISSDKLTTEQKQEIRAPKVARSRPIQCTLSTAERKRSIEDYFGVMCHAQAGNKRVKQCGVL
jgi:hypothetical protein